VRRRTQILLLVGGAAFTVVGVLLAVTGLEEPGYALLGIAPLGVGAVAMGLTPMASRKAPGVRLEEVRGRRSGRAVVFPLSKVKLRLIFVGQLCFAVMGLGLALYSDRALIGVLCTATFGLFALLSLPAVLSGGGVALLPEGLLVWGLPTGGFLPWEAMGELQDIVGGGQGLGITASDPAKLEAPRGSGLLRAANRALGYQTDISVSASTLGVELEVVAAAIEHVRRHPQQRWRLGTPESLTDLGLVEKD